MSHNIPNGFLQFMIGFVIIAFHHLPTPMFLYGIGQFIFGIVIWTLSSDEDKYKHVLLTLNLIAFWVGFGFFIGPIVGICGLQKKYF